jgi:hypothetical protein
MEAVSRKLNVYVQYESSKCLTFSKLTMKNFNETIYGSCAQTFLDTLHTFPVAINIKLLQNQAMQQGTEIAVGC